MKKLNVLTGKWSAVWMVLAVMAASCDFFEDLDVQNNNNPDKARLLSNPDDYPSIVGGAYLDWWSSTQKSDPQWSMTVAAQVMTSSWGNWGAWDVGRIPSEPIQNSQTYVYRAMYETPWYGLNGALATVNEVMDLMINGGNSVVIDGNDLTPMTITNGKIIQGLSLGHLGLNFDQAFIADEDSDLGSLTMSPYPEVIDAALGKLDEAIALANANTFTNPEWIPGHAFTNVQLAKFANTMAARILAYSPRTRAETEALNWTRVLNYTNNGIDFDFAPLGDGGIVWWDRIKIQGQDALWARVSQRIIRMMSSNPESDPGAVYPWPNNVPNLPEFTSNDNRATTDFIYAGAPAFNASRGYYFFGAYRYRRYDAYRASFAGPMMAVPRAENNLLKAEALIRTGGNKTTAAELINLTRVGRGNLAPLTGAETNQAMLDAIMYERYVEFGWAHPPVVFYDRRRTDDLEPNRYTQLPVPARELNVLGLPVYTFGGDEN